MSTTQWTIGDRVRATKTITHPTLPDLVIAEAGDEGTVMRPTFQGIHGPSVVVQFDKDQNSRSAMFEPIPVDSLEKLG